MPHSFAQVVAASPEESSAKEAAQPKLQKSSGKALENIPQLIDTRKAAEILGRSVATLKRWRCEGIGPNWIEIEGRVSYDVVVLLEFIQKGTRVASVPAAMEDARG